MKKTKVKRILAILISVVTIASMTVTSLADNTTGSNDRRKLTASASSEEDSKESEKEDVRESVDESVESEKETVKERIDESETEETESEEEDDPEIYEDAVITSFEKLNDLKVAAGTSVDKIMKILPAKTVAHVHEYKTNRVLVGLSFDKEKIREAIDALAEDDEETEESGSEEDTEAAGQESEEDRNDDKNTVTLTAKVIDIPVDIENIECEKTVTLKLNFVSEDEYLEAPVCSLLSGTYKGTQDAALNLPERDDGVKYYYNRGYVSDGVKNFPNGKSSEGTEYKSGDLFRFEPSEDLQYLSAIAVRTEDDVNIVSNVVIYYYQINEEKDDPESSSESQSESSDEPTSSSEDPSETSSDDPSQATSSKEESSTHDDPSAEPGSETETEKPSEKPTAPTKETVKPTDPTKETVKPTDPTKETAKPTAPTKETIKPTAPTKETEKPTDSVKDTETTKADEESTEDPSEEPAEEETEETPSEDAETEEADEEETAEADEEEAEEAEPGDGLVENQADIPEEMDVKVLDGVNSSEVEDDPDNGPFNFLWLIIPVGTAVAASGAVLLFRARKRAQRRKRLKNRKKNTD